MQIIKKGDPVSHSTRDRKVSSKGTPQRYAHRHRAKQEDGHTSKHDRVPSVIGHREILSMVRTIEFDQKSFIENKDLNIKHFISELIKLNNSFSSKPGYFDRSWKGDETITEIVLHLDKVCVSIYGKNLDILFDEKSNVRFNVKYEAKSRYHGTHIELKNIVKRQEKNPELFTIMFESLAFIMEKYGICDLFHNTYFQMTIENIACNIEGFDSDVECDDHYNSKLSEMETLIKSYTSSRSEIAKWFRKLGKPKREKALLKILNDYKGSSKRLRKFITSTINLINENSGLVLTDFVSQRNDNDDDENIDIVEFVEGMSVYWDDDHITTEAFDYINNYVNEYGITTPTLVRNLTEDSKTEPITSNLVMKIQDWLVQLNDLSNARIKN